MDSALILPVENLNDLFVALSGAGYETWAPVEREGSLEWAPVTSAAALPRGLIDDTAPGSVRLGQGERNAYFDYTLPMQGLKRMVMPAREQLFTLGPDLQAKEPPVAAAPRALIGVRPCDLAGLDTLATVVAGGAYPDTRFRQRRDALLLVAVNCMRAARTCFCAAMNTGPRAERGHDLVLDEIIDDDRHIFLVSAGSDRGRNILAKLPGEAAGPADLQAARDGSKACARSQERDMPSDVEDLLKRNYDHPLWSAVGERCLSCANCTMVCPTCFCTTIEDASSLDGETAERTRRWDSCFGLDYSYIHGGAVRTETASRYRQWITHKLSHWHDQFGTSGCVGCGRCIAWCPVGIDITAEVAALSAAEKAGQTQGEKR